MAIDKDFLNGIFEGVEGADVRIDKILKEYESDVTGLKVKNNELLSKNKEFNGSIEKLTAEHGTKEADFLKKIESLEAQIKASGGDELKAVYEGEVKKLQEMYTAKLTEAEKSTTQQKTVYDGLYAEYLRTLENTEYDRAMNKHPNLRPEMKEALRSILRDRNKFELTDLEGVKSLRNPKDNYKTIEDVVTAFVATEEGKSFVLCNSTGGGASGGSKQGVTGGMPRRQFDALPYAQQASYMKEGGKVRD
jgi:hypothetical protein